MKQAFSRNIAVTCGTPSTLTRSMSEGERSKTLRIRSQAKWSPLLTLRVTVAWLVCLSGCATRAEPTAMEFNFHRDVIPIFKTRCWNCHGATQQQGGLRLDEKAFALQGGLSGKRLMGESAATSELLKRITSEDPAIAMPKEGGRLSGHEVAILRRWIELGAPWPNLEPPSGSRELAARYGDDLWRRLSVVGREIKIYLLLFFAVSMGVADRIRRVPADNVRWSCGLRQRIRRLCQYVSATWFLVGLLSVVLWDLVEYAMRQSAQLATIEAELRTSSGTPDTRPNSMTGTAPMPLRVRNAPQLGGTYYRGNDERNEKLFNGGYYRTAAMRLSLLDEQDRPVPLGQLLPGSQLFIRLEVERALGATPALFNDAAMTQVILSRRTPEQKLPFPADQPTKLETLESGDRWGAKYRLADYDGQPDAALNGIVYVYSSGNRSGEAVSGSQQYGIVYALRIRDRSLQDNSELWLGPILVPGNFQYPDPRKITLPEWLDCHPIPEITGENSSDPALLGVPEHLNR